MCKKSNVERFHFFAVKSSDLSFLPLIRRYLEKLPLHVKGALRKIKKSGATGRLSLQRLEYNGGRASRHPRLETEGAFHSTRIPV